VTSDPSSTPIDDPRTERDHGPAASDGDGIPVRRLVGVYHASGTLTGELAYWVGARLGRAHCALCDITHGTFRMKSGWKTCRAGLPVPFETFHLDERDDAVRAASEGSTPCVLADTGTGLVLLLGPDELEACAGSPEQLVDAIDRAVTRAGLRFGQPAPHR
jgi:hypothetical protein